MIALLLVLVAAFSVGIGVLVGAALSNRRTRAESSPVSPAGTGSLFDREAPAIRTLSPTPAPAPVAPDPPRVEGAEASPATPEHRADQPAPSSQAAVAAPTAAPSQASPAMRSAAVPARAGSVDVAEPLTVPTPSVRKLWAPPHADLADEVAKVPKRRREDFLPEEERGTNEPLPQAELPPGFTDPITGLPLAEAMRADIELRATDFKTFTVVVCHPMRAMTTPGGMVNVSVTASFDEVELRLFASVLRDTLRQRDIVGRWDERLFLLFLPRCKVEEVRIVMDRIRAQLLLVQIDQPQWVDIAFGASPGQIGQSVDVPLRVAYADLLQRNTQPAWFLEP